MSRPPIYALAYGDWVRREASRRRQDLSEFEALLQVTPIHIETYGLFARSRAMSDLEALTKDVDVITDFSEREAEVTKLLGARLSGVYVVCGTAITLLDHYQEIR